MIIEYSKTKSIAVLELSSSGVKSISACPLHTRKKDDLSKFSDYHVVGYNLFQLIDKNNVIDEEKFESEILPSIIISYQRIINGRNLQAFKIIATGYYRLAVNSSDIIKKVENAIITKSGKKSFSIEVLSKVKESQLSFISWYSTNKSLPASEDFKTQYFNNNSIGISIDCGGATIEVSFLKNLDDFSNTLSLLTEITKESTLLANKAKFSSEDFDKVISELVAKALSIISENYTRKDNISFCVITGSNVSNFCNSVFNGSKETITTDSINFPLLLLKSKLESTYNTYSVKERENNIKQILSISAIKAILGFLKINSFSLNNANLRVGCYYDMLSRLRENKSPYN